MGVAKKNVVPESIQNLEASRNANKPDPSSTIPFPPIATHSSDPEPALDRASRPKFEILDQKELAAQLGVPVSWIRVRLHPGRDVIIPHFKFGQYARFRWGSPELDAWGNGKMLWGKTDRANRHGDLHEFEVIDCVELALRWKLPVTWVRDHVRVREQDPIPHLQLGKYVRFRWGAPELDNWLDRRMIGSNNRSAGRVSERRTHEKNPA